MFNRESEAWAHLAQRIETQGLTYSWFCPKGEGLCFEIENLELRSEISVVMYEHMSRRISSHMTLLNTRRDGEGRAGASVWLAAPGKAEPRIIAAQLLALEAAEEEDAEARRAEVDARTNYQPEPDEFDDEEFDDEEFDDEEIADDEEILGKFFTDERTDFGPFDEDDGPWGDLGLWDSADEGDDYF